MSCNVLFDSAWAVCCDTQNKECEKLAAKASRIECLIAKAAAQGKYYVIVNKCELWDPDRALITGLEEACYTVEFLPNSQFGGGPVCQPGSCSNASDPEADPEETENGFYKISWCVCKCNSGTSSSCACSGLSSSCTSSSLSCECLDSSTSAACESL